MNLIGLVFAMLLFGLSTLHAQVRTPACALVCVPPAVLNDKSCSCEEPAPAPTRPCALVCLNPDETLDAKRCKCVKS